MTTTWHRYRCPGCSYEYHEQRGEPHEGFPPGTRWEAVPDDWACPDCAVRQKPDFELLAEADATDREQRHRGSH